MKNIIVIDNSYTDVTSHADENDPWSRDSTHTTHSIQGIKIVTKHTYHDLPVNFELKAGENYWLLYGLYSTGDSFGNDTGLIEFLELYNNKARAQKAYELLIKRLRENKPPHSIKSKDKLSKWNNGFVSVPSASGKLIDMRLPNFGDYFGGTEDICLESVQLQ